jgi:CD2 antigen cytoplasmic tail-binding protein 2
MSSNKKRGVVRFNESAAERHRGPFDGNNNNNNKNDHGGNDDGDDDGDDRKPAAIPKSSASILKKAKRYRPNEDELDDIDDWNEREDGDEEDRNSILPSEAQLIEAKRQRRQKRGGGTAGDDGEGGTHIDAETSLAAEGIKIEPFHMRDEETDGTGYFDGDTYVFRRLAADDDGEPDAWADSLRDENGNPTTDLAVVPPATKDSTTTRSTTSSKNKSLQENLDDWTKEQLYARILPLVSDSETIANAIRRYGQLVKQQQKGKKKFSGAKPSSAAHQNVGDDDEHIHMAKSCLDDLTGAANALLLQGEVDIYDTTREKILRMFPAQQDDNHGGPKPSTAAVPVQWEYMGNQDNTLHGPFTTEQMLGWAKAGYFVGTQRVKIRAIQQVEAEKEETKLSTEEDLLADLMDDDDGDDGGDDNDKIIPPAKKLKTNTIKGEWMWSNEVNYHDYLCSK